MRVCKYCKQEWKNGQIQCQSCGSKTYWDIEETEGLNRPNNIIQESSKELDDRVKKNRIILVVCIIAVVVLAVVVGKKTKTSIEEKRVFEAEMTMNYEQGMAYYENGDYASAIRKLRNVDESYERYSEASSLLIEIEEAYKNNTLSEVDLLIEQENFAEASNKIEVLKELFSYDANIGVKAQHIQKQAILKNVDELMGEENYEEVISVIDSSDTELRNDSEVRLKHNEAKTAYVSYIKMQAEEAYNSAGVSEAISVINDGLSVLPEDAEFLALTEKYNEKIPIDLFTMKPLVGKIDDNFYADVHYNEGYYEDNMGNSDYRYYWFGPEVELRFVLGKEYEKLEFSVGIADHHSDDDVSSWIEIYDGKRKLLETAHFTVGVRPESYAVDVSGVDELTIILKPINYLCDYAMLLMSEFWISK